MTATEKVGSVSSASVQKATGKTWDQWIAILDKAGARGWTHGEIVAYLRKRFRPGPWWEQQVTTGFEIATGKREAGRNAKGELSLTATRTIGLSSAKLWKLLGSAPGLEAWLKPLSPVRLKPGASFETTDGYYGEIRTMLAGRRVRLTWQDPSWEKKTVVQIHVIPRVGEKSLLAINHEQIRDGRVQARMRARWKQAIEAISALA